MLILEDFAAGDEIIESGCNGDAWLSDVIFKDEFLNLLQKTLEHHKEKLFCLEKKEIQPKSLN